MALDTTVWRSLSNQWHVADLLERSVCSIIGDPDDQFRIVTTTDELPLMRDVRRGPFTAVEGAMTAIEMNLHGPCRYGAAVGRTTISLVRGQ